MEDQGPVTESVIGRAFRNAFGAGAEAGISHPDLIKFLTLAGGLALLLFLRRPDCLTRPQFWAEDGAEFFYFQFYGLLPLFKPYAGYLHLVPRTVAALANLFPVRFAPLIYNIFALAIAAACSAWFSLPLFRHLVHSDRLRIAACLFIAATPTAGTVPLNLTNVQWYLLIWLGLVCFQPFPATRRGRAALLAAYAAAVLSSIVSVVLAPMLIARAFLVRKDRCFALVLAAVIVIYAAVLKIWLSPTTTAAGASKIGEGTITGLAGLIVSRVGIMGIAGPGAVGRLAAHPRIMFVVGGALLVALIGLAIWLARPHGPFAAFTALAAYLVASSIAMLVLFRSPQPPRDLFFTIGGARYFFFGVAVFYIWLAATADKLLALRWPRRVLYVIGAVMITATAIGFREAPFDDADWPRWAAGLEAARQSGSVFPGDVPINPRGWFIRGSGELPKNLDSIPMASLRISARAMEKESGGWVPAGPDPALIVALPAPRYVYAVSMTYEMDSRGKALDASAKISWLCPGAADLKTDPGLPALGPTPGGGSMRRIWVLDRATAIEIFMSPGVSTFRLLDVTVLAVPVPHGR